MGTLDHKVEFMQMIIVANEVNANDLVLRDGEDEGDTDPCPLHPCCPWCTIDERRHGASGASAGDAANGNM